jgi:hypothetical protein
MAMKIIAILIMLAALFLLYRIACPKQATSKRDRETSPEKPGTVPDVVGKSRYVAAAESQPQPLLATTTATSKETEKAIEKQDTFAPETEKNRSAVIPPDELDAVFDDSPHPEDLDIPPDDDEHDDGVDYQAEDEAEELNRVTGGEERFAESIDFEDLQAVRKVVEEQPAEVSDETAKTIEKLENTDMFEWLVSGDEGKANWIKAVVERNIQNVMPETEKTEDKTSDETDYGNFDVAEFLS